jgi:hypothetical protein
MRRWVAVAALGAAFLTQSAWAQRRGGSSGGLGHAGFIARGSGFGGRGSMMSRPAFNGVQRGGVHFRAGFNRPFASPFFFHHHGRFFRSWPYYGYPYYSSPWYYGDDSYSADSYPSYPPPDYSRAYFDNNREQAEINRLENEVDRLRQEQETRAAPPAPQRTQLVFRNKRVEEVQNYAIVGQTFWVFSEQRARKIPLDDLDLSATKKANDDRGVEFQLPE